MRYRAALFAAAIAATLAGCDQPAADAPPEIRLDDSVCYQCNMIISDERWATATIIAGPRGAEARLFDDFNCQVHFEVENPDEQIITRWSHSHATREWLRTEHATFLVAADIRSPMSSQTAAFSTEEEAKAANAQTPGDILTFELAWNHLGFSENSDQAQPAADEANTGP